MEKTPLKPRACLITGQMFTPSHPRQVFSNQAAYDQFRAAGHTISFHFRVECLVKVEAA